MVKTHDFRWRFSQENQSIDVIDIHLAIWLWHSQFAMGKIHQFLISVNPGKPSISIRAMASMANC